jgi:hypothetical protein
MRWILTIIVFQLFCGANYPQESDIKSNSFYYPHVLDSWEYIHSLGLTTANLPEDIVESDDEFRAPLYSYKAKFGLPENFLLEGGISTNLITLNISLGPKWTYEFNNFSLSAGADAAFFIGALDQFDFKTKIRGWMAYPNLTLGYCFPNFSVTVKSDLILVFDQTAKTGNIEVTSDFKTISGFSVGAFIEQPLWKNNFFVMGVKANFTRFYYPMWITFSTFDRLFFIPEAIFSFNL